MPNLNAAQHFWLKAFAPHTVKFLRYFDYEGDYDGSGCALAELQDGTWIAAEYSHCSCVGPEETLTVIPASTQEDARRSLTQYLLEDLDRNGTNFQP